MEEGRESAREYKLKRPCGTPQGTCLISKETTRLTPLFTAKSKKQRQRAAKALRKRALLNPESLAPKVPLYEQSVDLPGGDGSLEAAKEAGQARSGLTKAMRDKRRKMIKEDNFLRAMG